MIHRQDSYVHDPPARCLISQYPRKIPISIIHQQDSYIHDPSTRCLTSWYTRKIPLNMIHRQDSYIHKPPARYLIQYPSKMNIAMMLHKKPITMIPLISIIMIDSLQTRPGQALCLQQWSLVRNSILYLHSKNPFFPNKT